MTRAATEDSWVEAQGVPGVDLSDRSLLRRFQSGCQDAAALLYERYAERLRALVRAQCPRDLARRVDADDIVQSVFRSFFQRADQGYYEVPAGEELWKLFLIIALNKIRHHGAFHRAAKRDVRLTAGGADAEWSLEHLPQEDGAYALMKLGIDAALETLPEEHRAAVQRRIEGYQVAEIAREMGRSKRSVERLLQESRQRLEAHFQEE